VLNVVSVGSVHSERHLKKPHSVHLRHNRSDQETSIPSEFHTVYGQVRNELQPPL